MKLIILIITLTSSLAFASDEVKFDQAIAIEKARVELREFAYLSEYEIDIPLLSETSKVLSGIDKKGNKIVKVLFPASKGIYEVTFIINKDGWLIRDSVGASARSIQEESEEFNKEPYVYEY